MIATKYCENVFDGTHDSPKPDDSGSHRLLTSKNILNGVLDITDSYTISDKDYEAINKRSAVHQWDVLFSMIGTVGNVYIVTDETVDYAIKNMGVFSCKDEYKAKWLYYFLQSPYCQKLISVQMNGAIQKFVPLGWLRDLDIPDYTEDKKEIVDILWNIERKINLNNSICTDLESLAKEIYDYWFVQFDFPDANGNPYKSSGGAMEWNDELKREIPKGWSNIKFDDIVLPAPKCKSIKAPDYKTTGKYPIVDQASDLITGYTDDNTYVYNNPNDCVVFGDVTTYFKFINFPFAKGTDGTKIIETIDNRIPASLMYQLIKNTILPNVGFARHYSFLREIQVLLPDENICRKYDDTVKSLMDKRCLCIEENKELTELRDFLLPMLMNGQIKVGA